MQQSLLTCDQHSCYDEAELTAYRSQRTTRGGYGTTLVLYTLFSIDMRRKK